MAHETYVTVEQKNGYALVEFAGGRANAMPKAVLDQLADAIQTAASGTSTRAILLQSAGTGAFCAGADFTELASLKDVEQGQEFFMGFARVILAIVNAPVFVLGRVQGKAVGGGVGIIAACDYVLAHSSAAVALTELKLGLGPYVIGPVVERRIGLAAFSELALTAEFKSGEWCLQKGLFQSVYADLQQLDKGCQEILSTWVNFDRPAVEQFKRTLSTGLTEWAELLKLRAGISAHLTLSSNVQSRIKAQLK